MTTQTMTPQEHVEMARSRKDWAWQFFRVMSSQDHIQFDQWLVETQHPLAYQAGTTERRFRQIVEEGQK